MSGVGRLQTLFGVPYAADPSGAGAAFLGLPFDCGTDPQRVGARLGPQALRRASARLQTCPPDGGVDPSATLGLVDCGDLDLVSGDVEGAFAAIEAGVGRLLDVGAVPVTAGGDGAVTLPQLRALARRHRDLVAIHLDAHTDAYPQPGYTTATTFSRAAEEGLLDTSRSVHLGARGTTSVAGVYAHARSLGYRLVPMAELLERGLETVVAEVRELAAGRPVYLCLDLDVFDASAAPGVCDPSFGGLSAREGLSLLRGLGGLDIVAVDLNTLSPPHDPGGITALLAATALVECLLLLTRRLG